VVGEEAFALIMEQVTPMVMEAAQAALECAHVPKQNQAVLSFLGSRMATLSSAKVKRVMMMLQEVTTLVDDPPKLTTAVIEVAEEVLGKEIVAEVIDSACDTAFTSVMDAFSAQLEKAKVPQPYVELVLAMGPHVGEFVLQHGLERLKAESEAVLATNDPFQIQSSLLDMCVMVVGEEAFALIMEQVTPMVMEAAQAALECAHVPKQHQAVLSFLGSRMATLSSAKVKRVMMMLQEVTTLVDNPPKLTTAVIEVAEEVLGKEIVAEVIDSAQQQVPDSINDAIGS